MSSKEKVELCEAVYFMRDIKTIGDLWESAFLLQWTEIRPIIRSDAGTDATYDSKVSFFFFKETNTDVPNESIIEAVIQG